MVRTSTRRNAGSSHVELVQRRRVWVGKVPAPLMVVPTSCCCSHRTRRCGWTLSSGPSGTYFLRPATFLLRAQPCPCPTVPHHTAPHPDTTPPHITPPRPTPPNSTLPHPSLPRPTHPPPPQPAPPHLALPHLLPPCPAPPSLIRPCPAHPCPALPCPALPCPAPPRPHQGACSGHGPCHVLLRLDVERQAQTLPRTCRGETPPCGRPRNSRKSENVQVNVEPLVSTLSRSPRILLINGCDLGGRDLSGCNLNGCDLNGRDMAGVT